MSEIEIPERVIEAAAKVVEDDGFPGTVAVTALQVALKEWGALEERSQIGNQSSKLLINERRILTPWEPIP